LKNESNAILATAYRVQGGKTEAFDPPITILPADLNLGTEWNYHGPIAGLDLNLPLKVVGEGDIDVPAGKFRALHFRGEKNEGLFTVADFWFVRGVGSIKETVTQRSPSGDLLTRNTIELAKLPARRQSEPVAEKKKLEASVSTSSDGDPLTSFPKTRCRSWRAGVVMPAKTCQIRAVGLHKIPIAPVDFKVDEANRCCALGSASGNSPSRGHPTVGRTEYRSSFMSMTNLPRQ
jgi:hypothetical protein